MYNYNTISTATKTLNDYALETMKDRMGGFPQTYVVDGRLYFPYIKKTIEPKKVIFNNPATIVIWSDGSKTVSKCNEEDKYDKVKGFLVCYYKKHKQLSNSKFSKLYDKILENDVIEF